MKWDQVFHHICDSMFKLTAKHITGTVSATGFLVARYKQSEEIAFAVATAGHVFRPLAMYADVEWTLQRFNLKGDDTGWVTFTSNIEKLGNSPIRTNLEADVGLVFIPKLAFEAETVRIVDPRFAIKPGAKVGWAGYPEFVSKEIGKPLPCYFEGVISAVVDSVEQDGKLFYLVDGHGGKGVSGGPLWCWNEDHNNYEVIGICSRYIFSGDGGPGIILFESINRVVAYSETSSQIEMQIIR